MVSLQVFSILDLDKEYEGYVIKHLLKPIYTNMNYVESDNSLKMVAKIANLQISFED